MLKENLRKVEFCYKAIILSMTMSVSCLDNFGSSPWIFSLCML